MGRTTNINKSTRLTTTRRTRDQAKSISNKGLQMKLVPDFKLLGHTWVGAHQVPATEAQDVAEEARTRTRGIETLPVSHQSEIKFVGKSPMKFFTVATQWGWGGSSSFINSLTADIMRVVRGGTRAMRCSEIVFGVFCGSTRLEPIRSMIWSTLADARRMILKDSDIEEQATLILQSREDRVENDFAKQVNAYKIEASNGIATQAEEPPLLPAIGLDFEAEARSRSGVEAGLDPSRPLGVGFDL